MRGREPPSSVAPGPAHPRRSGDRARTVPARVADERGRETLESIAPVKADDGRGRASERGSPCASRAVVACSTAEGRRSSRPPSAPMTPSPPAGSGHVPAPGSGQILCSRRTLQDRRLQWPPASGSGTGRRRSSGVTGPPRRVPAASAREASRGPTGPARGPAGLARCRSRLRGRGGRHRRTGVAACG